MQRRTHLALLALAGFGGLGLGCVILVDDDCSAVECGENAFCDRGVCECVGGFDGDPDEICDPIQSIWVEDECDDGLDIEFVLWADGREWKWPAGSDVYFTPGLGVNTEVSIVCIEGETVCWGAESGDRVWGVGLDGTYDCVDCCFECFPDLWDVGELRCD